MTVHICTRCGYAEADEFMPNGTPPDHLAWIVARVAEDSDKLTVRGIMNSRHRARHLLEARRRIYLVLRDSGNSYPQIGAMFGKDHTTIMHAVKNAKPFDVEYGGAVFKEYRRWARAQNPEV